jgi:hypothetical protein
MENNRMPKATAPLILSLLLVSFAGTAQEEITSPRFELKDGTRIQGNLQVERFTVQTAYGPLTVPAKDVYEIVFGKNADPGLMPRIQKLIAQLGSDAFEDRETATRELLRMETLAIEELRRARKEAPDAEVRARAQEVLDALPPELEPARMEDQIKTTRFTILGTLETDRFSIGSPYGTLEVHKKDIRRLLLRTPHLREKTVQVEPTQFGSFLATGVQLQPGYRLRVKASGSLYLPSLGMTCTPEGLPQYTPQGTDPLGKLLGRIGANGKPFPIGEKHDAEIHDQEGELYLGLALPPQMNYVIQQPNNGGSFQVRISLDAE